MATHSKGKNQKPNTAYYIPMSAAVGAVKRISKSQAVDSKGNLIQTNNNVVRVGSGLVGQPRKVETAAAFIDMFGGFTDWIKKNGFAEYPTKKNFSIWAGLSYETILNYINKTYGEKKSTYQEILADCLTEGVNAGAYDRQMSIFCLKNWCGWADRAETVTTTKAEPVDKATADRLIRQYVDNLPQSE